jgi:hypothetical protein
VAPQKGSLSAFLEAGGSNTVSVQRIFTRNFLTRPSVYRLSLGSSSQFVSNFVLSPQATRLRHVSALGGTPAATAID